MTVAELKAELDNFGDHLQVLIDNTEALKSTYCDITGVNTGHDIDGVAAVSIVIE